LKLQAVTGKATQCFNVDSQTRGSFAVIYHKDTFKLLVDWIDQAREPFDRAWVALARLGEGGSLYLGGALPRPLLSSAAAACGRDVCSRRSSAGGIPTCCH
jgi:hypothetical protein